MEQKRFEDFQWPKDWRIVQVALKTILIFACIFLFVAIPTDEWISFLVKLFYILSILFLISIAPPYNDRYRIDESGISIITKKGKIRKYMRWDELGVQVRAKIFFHRGSPQECLIFIRKGQEDILIADKIERVKWLRSKHTVYLRYSQEISDFVYEKTGITLLNVK